MSIRNALGLGPGSRHNRWPRGILAPPTPVAPWTLVLLLAAPLAAQDEIFSDGFESGNTSAWSATLGVAPTAFRFSDLDLRDPHLFVEVDIIIPLCFDFTDEAVPGLDTSFNQMLEDQLTLDGGRELPRPRTRPMQEIA